ncbi:MAG: mono/diheme cytochrome c family protein [Limisphaerales bacterium]|jgi:mono/diheme cytochrome c family protein
MYICRLAIISLFSFLVSCGNNSAEYSDKKSTSDNVVKEQTSSLETKEIQLGLNVYKATCRLCHGIDGKMGVSGAANLSISQLSEEEAIEVIKNGRKLMQAYKDQLSTEEIAAVTKYIQSFKGG